MNILVTGGAGFIGRWVVKQLLNKQHNVTVLDDLSNGQLNNITEFEENEAFTFLLGDIKNEHLLDEIYNEGAFELCYHLGASINIQDSIDHPRQTFDNDTVGTFYIMEQCRKHSVKVVFMSTCMVYDRCFDKNGITEDHPLKPASPYAGSKIAAENIVLSYYYAYNLPVVVVRPFNTYGPFQKTGGEGGVVAIFIKKKLNGESIQIYGDGTQTRDLLFVEDCADFVIRAGLSDKVNGQILNAGLGQDVSINELAKIIADQKVPIEHVDHIHPQSEIQKLLCNYEKATKLLNWSPKFSLLKGIQKTEEWIKEGHLV
ncbi:nucleoside-diphosphate-sugar epimerase [Natronobacillus azotifigens]|uniref:GDP-mannose 4,6-dehydratase n=1 Tax=Natronobacillus azotifigens TaxID=472978 RepID=A0A9J6R8V9_9BACI|nr:NAD-dependent epimerase/dehydratase family protein [Natronobacillus azotifigens]MCZ0702098.1 GDP-mannose 4,6-dehydratase [Natronobacillus azotifigens]